MPIYEYRCEECEQVFSRLQRMGAASSGIVCPGCGSQRIQRQVSAFASTSGSPPLGAGPPPGCGPST